MWGTSKVKLFAVVFCSVCEVVPKEIFTLAILAGRPPTSGCLSETPLHLPPIHDRVAEGTTRTTSCYSRSAIAASFSIDIAGHAKVSVRKIQSGFENTTSRHRNLRTNRRCRLLTGSPTRPGRRLGKAFVTGCISIDHFQHGVLAWDCTSYRSKHRTRRRRALIPSSTASNDPIHPVASKLGFPLVHVG